MERKCTMTFAKCILTFLIVFVSVSLSFSQPIQLNPDGKGYLLNSTRIDTQTNEIISTKQNNIAARFFSSSKTCSSSDGQVLFSHGKLIKMENGQPFTVELPKSNLDSFEFSTVLSGDGNWLIYKTQEELGNINTETVINLFNVNTRTTEHQYTFQGSVEGLTPNFNTTIIVFSSAKFNDRDFALIRDNEGLNLEEFSDVGSLRFFSDLGHRIFGYPFNQNLDKRQWIYVDRMGTTWSQPIELEVFNNDGNKLEFIIYDIANDGKTLLISHENFGLAVVHENEGEWGLPQPLGYQPDPLARDEFQISENGEVVAVQSFKKVVADVNLFYDALLFFKTDTGTWKKQQVNSPDVDVLPDILLTDDGTKLFWLPKSESSVTMGGFLR